MKIINRKLFVVLALVLALMFTGSAQEALPEPVWQAVLDAVNSNPEVQRRWHAFLASEQEQRVARGGYLPEVDLRLSAARQWQDSGDGRVDRDPLSAALTLNQMLYDGFFTRSEVRRLGHSWLVRYFELMEAAEQAALDALRAYMDVERHRELFALAEDNYRAHREAYEQVEELVRTGVGRGVDLEQAAGRLALAESNLLTEIANLHDVSARFLRVIGRMPTDDFVDLDVMAVSERLALLDQHQLSSDRVRTAYRQQFNIGQRTLLDLLDAETSSSSRAAHSSMASSIVRFRWPAPSLVSADFYPRSKSRATRCLRSRRSRPSTRRRFVLRLHPRWPGSITPRRLW